MRDVPDQQLSGWQPPTYEVDANGKVVGGGGPREPNNWGRWGADDQRGTTNLLTPERVAAAAQLVRTGKRFSLGLPVGGPPTPGFRPAVEHLFTATTGDKVLGEFIQYSDDWLVMNTQATTQLDGLAHFGAKDLLYNGYWAGLVTATSGARRLGMHHQANGVVGRGVLLDVARQLSLERLEPGFAIDGDLLAATAEQQGVEVRAGDILLVRTGHLGWWFALEDRSSFVGSDPGLSPRAIPWLAERDVALVATDTLAVEVLPPEEGLPPLALHVGALRDLGLLLGELFDLDELAADCAEDRVYEFFFVAAPLPIVNGVASPLNPIAIK